jgi:hypothetical protein
MTKAALPMAANPSGALLTSSPILVISKERGTCASR